MRRLPIGVILSIGLVIAACSSGGASSAPVGSADDPNSSTTTTAASSGTSQTTVPSSTTTTVAEPGPPSLALPGAPPLVLLTGSGGGVRPLLEWEPLSGAVRYVVTVYAETGGPYWAAETVDPSLQVGDPALPDDAMGPKIADGYAWSVFAFDDSDRLIASSELRTISP